MILAYCNRSSGHGAEDISRCNANSDNTISTAIAEIIARKYIAAILMDASNLL
jgi:hypothetical protein